MMSAGHEANFLTVFLVGDIQSNLAGDLANRRLFSNVRERKQLTYDANFSFTGFERLLGGEESEHCRLAHLPYWR